MAKQTITLHMYLHTSGFRAGERGINEFDFRCGSEDPVCGERVWLGSQDVEIDWPETDTRQLQVDALEREITQFRAESQGKINLLLERISKLQAIGHDQ